MTHELAATQVARTQVRGSRLLSWLCPCLVFLVTALTFSGALSNEFVDWDDDLNFTHNRRIQGWSLENLGWMFTSFHVGHYMPLTWLSCALDHSLWGLDPRGYHLTNVLLHAGTAVLLQRVVRRLLVLGAPSLEARSAEICASFGAFAFALHPLRVESVAWATERRDVLAGLFLVATAWAWLRSLASSPESRGWRVAAHALFAASLMSKVSGMTLPFALLVLDFYPLRRPRSAALLTEKLGLFALALAAATVGVIGQGAGTQVLASTEAVPPLDRVAIAVRAVVFYLQKTVAPLDLSPLYELDGRFAATQPATLGALAVVASMSWIAWRMRRALPAGLAAWITFLVLLAPTVGLVQSGRQLAADRYAYVASLALAPFIAAALILATRRCAKPAGRWVLALACALVLSSLAAATVRQVRVWRDGESLWRQAVAVDRESAFARHKLGTTLHRARRFDEAIEQYELGLSLPPGRSTVDLHYDLALSKLALSDVECALTELDRTLTLAPRHAPAWRALEEVLVARGQGEQMIERYSAAIERDPTFVDTRLGLSRVLASARRFEEALRLAESAIALAPDSAPAHNRAGMNLLHLDRAEQAEARFRRALELRGEDADVWTNLGVALEKQGRSAAAREAWERALAFDPGHAGARRRLGP